MTDLDRPNFTPVTPRSRQQDSRTDGEQPAAEPHARARAAGAREALTVPALSVITERVGRVFANRPAPGEGRSLWHDGAESVAEVMTRVREQGELVAAAPTRGVKALALGWALWLLVVGVPLTAALAGLQYVATHPLSLAVAIPLGFLVLASAGVFAGDVPPAQGVTP